MTNETEDALYEMAEQAWNDLWPDEPDPRDKTVYRGYLFTVFNRLLGGYDGPLSDIADLLGDFSQDFISRRVEAILEDAREAEAQALADSREDW